MALEGLRGEDSIAELCCREGIAQNLYKHTPIPPRNSLRGALFAARAQSRLGS
jgi:hypothetical protein